MSGCQEWRDRRNALYVNAISSHQNQREKGGEKMARRKRTRRKRSGRKKRTRRVRRRR